MSKLLPTLLHKMVAEARVKNTPEPAYQCQAGFCGQCACSVELVQSQYGDFEYSKEPAVPPFEGEMLPCVAREKVRYFDLNEFPSLLREQFGEIAYVKQKSLLARLPAKTEIGQVCDVPSPKRTSHTVSLGVISEKSVIVQSLSKGESGAYPTMLSTKSDFMRSFGALPTNDNFLTFSKDIECKGVYVSQQVIDYLSTDNNAAYVKTTSEEILILEVGDIIMSSGNVIDRKKARELTSTFLNNAPTYSM